MLTAIDDSPASSTHDELLRAHRNLAAATWKKIALSEPRARNEQWDLRSRARLLDSPSAAEKLAEFCALRGSLFINGLASCAIGDHIVHPFETHGYSKRISFHGDGRAHFRAQLTDTPCAVAEREQGRLIYRGIMSNGLGFPADLTAPKGRDTANIALRAWPPTADAYEHVLIASGDNGMPYALDPTTLETRGTLAMAFLDPRLNALEDKRLLAHTRHDAAKGRLCLAATDVALSHRAGDEKSVFDFYEIDQDGAIVSHVTHETSFMVMHDFVITENYYVIPHVPAKMSMRGLALWMLGLGRGLDTFQLESDQPSSLLLIPRDPSSGRVPIEAKALDFFNIFHFGTCYERPSPAGGTEVVVTAIAYDTYKFGRETGFNAESNDFDPIGWADDGETARPALNEFVVDLDSGRMVSRRRLPLMCTPAGGGPMIDVACDMPTTHPLRDGLEARFCYAAGANRMEGWFPFNAIIKADLLSQPVKAHAWFAPETCMVTEPLFLPRGKGASEWLGAEAEDDGFLVSIVHDAAKGRCELLLFDAQRFEEGPFATVDLGELYPWDTHASWLPDVTFD